MNPSTTYTTKLVRQAFLDFFTDKEHRVVPSAPLVPLNDPTLMFVNAGMVQFKEVFTGQEKRDYQRACSSQKCIRISGKHNDLENVGVTARHHTFFEMLGNFSFGDYFKDRAIELAWELLTKVFAIPAERMVVTVFGGEGEFEADDQAAGLWRKITGISEDRILRLGMADNFWSMGESGPCGPCSEVHFYHGPKPDLATFGQEPAADGTGWTEIWNLVFMQYDRPEKGAPVVPLPAPSIDTGAGLERVAGVLQGARSNYDTDLLRGLLERVAEIAGKPYGGTAAADDMSMRVIADHARTTAFLIAEGVLPDKQRREYVLRRVMRRAIRHGHRLGIEKPFLHQVALAVVEAMGADYPELVERKQLIEQVTEGEETRFRATLRRGMKILDDRFDKLRTAGSASLSAETAADLYTTYGFPLDLTEVIGAEEGFFVDTEAAAKLIEHTEDANGPIDPHAAVDPAYRQLTATVPATRFTGYETEHDQSEVLALVLLSGDEEHPERSVVNNASAPARCEVVVTHTPFYAESGGQVGDGGLITMGESALATVRDTQRPIGELTVHRVRLERGQFRVGDTVELKVDHQARTATRRNHSATHLLHWALREVLGPHAQQKGSRVGPNMLRFDFAHNAPLSQQQLEKIEDLVNEKILTNEAVITEVLPVQEARQRGAVAIFEEKYGETVRVVTMTDDSLELCGGTHAHQLGDIGMFLIESEGGTAAGVRRIFAATGLNSLAEIRGLQHDMQRAAVAAKAQGGDLADKVKKLVAKEKQLEKRVAELERQQVEGGSGDGGGLSSVLAGAQQVDDISVLAHRLADGTKPAALREVAERLRDKLGGKAVVLVACLTGKKAQLALMVSKNATDRVNAAKLIKPVAAHVGGSGGGRPDMAQAGGTKTEGIEAAMEALYGEVRRVLGE